MRRPAALRRAQSVRLQRPYTGGAVPRSIADRCRQVAVQCATPLQYFAALVAEDAGFALLEAAISIAQDEYPELDAQSVLSQIDALADQAQARVCRPTPCRCSGCAC